MPFPAWLVRLGHYGLVLLLVAMAALVRWALGEALDPAPFLVFYLAWVAAAAFGGLGPGLLATLASWGCVNLFFDSTPWHIGFSDPGSVSRFVVLLIGGLAVSVVGEKMRRARVRERRQTAELAVANAALRASEEKYRIVADNTYDWEFWVDVDNRFLYTSPSCASVTGYAAHEFMNRPGLLQEIIHPKDRAVFLQHRHEIPSGRHGDIEFRIIAKHDETRWIHHMCQPVYDKEGRYAGSRGSNRDITERKRAEEALAESRKRYRDLVEKINDWAWEIDANGVYTYVSPRALDLLGYTPEEIVGKTPFDLMPPAEAQRVWNAFEPIWREHQPLELLENTLARKDGRLVTVETSGMPLFAEDGVFLGYSGIDRDVTARQQAAEALRESEERFRKVFEEGPLGMVLTSRDFGFFRANPAFCRMLGYTPQEMNSLAFLDVTHPEHRAPDRDNMEKLWQGEIPIYRTQKRYIAKNGDIRWANLSASLIQDREGRPLYSLAIVEDITERKWAEEALQASEEKYRRIVEAATEAIVMVDAEARITFVNDRWSEIVGYRREESEQMTVFDLVFPGDAAVAKKRWECRKQGRKERYEFRLRRKDGSPVWVLLSMAPRFGPEGEFLGELILAVDIARRKQAEQDLRELNATLESRVARRTAQLQDRARQLQKLTLDLTEAEERERARIAEILHDDLQQVLAAAKFQVSLLGSRIKNDADAQGIAGRARDLLTDAIAKSRGLSHELSSPALAQSDLSTALEWLAEHLQTKHGFTVHLEAGERIEIASEPLRILLYKAAQELLFNAIKHAGVQEAKLRLRRQRGRLRLSVSDQGRGFDPTDPSYKLGFGLLSIRERIGLLGGRLKIRSAVGKGSTFVLTVPEAEDSP